MLESRLLVQLKSKAGAVGVSESMEISSPLIENAIVRNRDVTPFARQLSSVSGAMPISELTALLAGVQLQWMQRYSMRREPSICSSRSDLSFSACPSLLFSSSVYSLVSYKGAVRCEATTPGLSGNFSQVAKLLVQVSEDCGVCVLKRSTQ
jgi:hypothetical protein